MEAFRLLNFKATDVLPGFYKSFLQYVFRLKPALHCRWKLLTDESIESVVVLPQQLFQRPSVALNRANEQIRLIVIINHQSVLETWMKIPAGLQL